jgi:hypothetical protein
VKLPAKTSRTGLYAKSTKALRLRDNVIRWHMRKLRELCPWLLRSDSYLVRRFCELEFLASRAYQALRVSELTNKDGQSKRLLDDYRKLVQVQASLAMQLGLSPAARRMIKEDPTNPAIDITEERAQRAIDVSTSDGDGDAES